MLEILVGKTAPTLETVGEQGQLYIHQYQIGRRKFYGDLYICDIVNKYVNGPQDRDTIHYYWEKITPSKELEEKIKLNEIKIKIVPIENTLENNLEYRLFHMGKIGRMDFKLPETIPNVFKGKIFIRSSDKGIQLNIDNVTFIGEDCVDGKLISNTSKYYEIAYENVGVHDEQYAPNKAIVIARVSSLPLEG